MSGPSARSLDRDGVEGQMNFSPVEIAGRCNRHTLLKGVEPSMGLKLLAKGFTTPLENVHM